MSDMNVPPSGGSDIKVPILIGSVVALLGANIYLFTQLNGLRADLRGIPQIYRRTRLAASKRALRFPRRLRAGASLH